ncbi:7 transmembrane receptor (rhodopsin) [Mactra antiquata]
MNSTTNFSALSAHLDISPWNKSNNLTNSFSENSSVPPFPVFDELHLTNSLVRGTMSFFSLFGNISTIVQMYRMRRRKSTINTLIINLATADLLVTFFCMGAEAIWALTMQWYAGEFVCKAVKYAQVFALNLSTYITVVISLDRCFAIMDPISRNKAPRRVKIMLSLAWGLCALFSVPQIFIFKVVRGPWERDFVQCMDTGYNEVAWSKRVYSIVSLLFSFVIPLLIMAIAYGLISGTITRKSKDFRDPDESSTTSEHGQLRGQVRSHLFRKAKRKALRMSIVIVAAFIICWTPYYVVFMYITYLDIKQFSRMTLLALGFIGLSNCLLNPVIYGAFHLCKVHSPRCWKRKDWPSYRDRALPNNLDTHRIVVVKPQDIMVLQQNEADIHMGVKIKQPCLIVLCKVTSESNENLKVIDATSNE